MAVKILEIHHHTFRVGYGEHALSSARSFYEDVLGLTVDKARPFIPEAPGLWLDVAEAGQIHLIALSESSALAQGPGQDPTDPHVAFGVADIVETRNELDRLGVDYWSMNVVAKGTSKMQLFLNDPNGNLVELHQIGTCRCMPGQRTA